MVPRPAIILTPKPVGPGGLLLWAAMVTNAARPPWPDDIAIPDAVSLGLLIPSKIRVAKIFSVEASAATSIARLDDATMTRVAALVRRYLGVV